MPRLGPHVTERMTFGQYWEQGAEAAKAVPRGQPVAIGNRNLLVDQGDCNAGELNCWMNCYAPLAQGGVHLPPNA